MIVYPETAQQNLLLTHWIAQRIPDYTPGTDAVCLGVIRDGSIAAVAAFNNYRTTDIELSFAAETPRWATRETIAGILAYPFHQLKTYRVSALCLKSNKRVRRLLQGVGFIEEGKLRHAGPNKETMFVYGMTKDDYLKRYGKKETTQTPYTS